MVQKLTPGVKPKSELTLVANQVADHVDGTAELPPGDAKPVAARLRDLAANGAVAGELISIKLLRPDPNQPRKVFDRKSIEELAASIRRDGILQPLIVQGSPRAYFMIICGERRWRAAKLTGLTQVPCIVRNDLDARGILVAQMIENIQRQDLAPLEVARTLKRLVSTSEVSAQKLSDLLKRSRSWVSRHLRLLDTHASWHEPMQEHSNYAGAPASEAAISELMRLSLLDKAATKTIQEREVAHYRPEFYESLESEWTPSPQMPGVFKWTKWKYDITDFDSTDSWCAHYGRWALYCGGGLSFRPLRSVAECRRFADRVLAWLHVAIATFGPRAETARRWYIGPESYVEAEEAGFVCPIACIPDHSRALEIHEQLAPDIAKLTDAQWRDVEAARNRVDFVADPFEPDEDEPADVAA